MNIDVCNETLRTSNDTSKLDSKKVPVLINVTDTIGDKGQVNLAQWIREISVQWKVHYGELEQWTIDCDQTSVICQCHGTLANVVEKFYAVMLRAWLIADNLQHMHYI